MLSEIDEYLINKENNLNGLGVLLDVDKLAEFIKNSCDISCAVRADLKYIRYKPQTNCLVLYDVYVDNKHYTAYAKTYAYDADIKFKKSQNKKTFDWDYGKGRIYDEKTGTEICFFPNDNKLKYLRYLNNAESTQKLLASVLLRDPAEINNAVLSPLAYKPERRYVVKVYDDQTIFGALKFYTRANYQKALKSSMSFNSCDVFKTARMINHSDRYYIVSYEWLDGDLLSTDLRENRNIDMNVFSEIGRCLYYIHNKCCTGDLSFMDKKDRMYEIKESVDMVSYVCPIYKQRFDTIMSQIKDLLDKSLDVLKPIHGDFYSKQILLHKGNLGIIDFDRASMGDPAYDFGTMIAHFIKDEIKGFINWDVIETARDNLIRGYGGDIGKEFTDLVDVYTVIGLLNISPHFFRDHRDNWQSELEVLIEICEQMLANIRSNNIYFSIAAYRAKAGAA